MEFTNALGSCYLLGRAEKGRVMVRFDMGGDRGGLGGVSLVCIEVPKSRLRRGGVGSCKRREGRGERWVGRKLTLNFQFVWEGSR